MLCSWNKGFIFEEVDEEILVCDPDHSVVHRLSGESALFVREMRDHGLAEFEVLDSAVVTALVDVGILIPADREISPSFGVLGQSLGRRKMVKMGAVAATVGLVTLALPEAAAAASGDFTPTSSPEFSFSEQFGRVRVNWPSGPSSFSYDYSITVVSGTASADPLTGTVSSDSVGNVFTLIYTMIAGASITVTLTAQSPATGTSTRSFNYSPPV